MPRRIKIQIISRYPLIESSHGSVTHLLALMSYLRRIGFEIEHVSLDPRWGGTVPWCVISPALTKIARIVARDNLRIGWILVRPRPFCDWIILHLLPMRIVRACHRIRKELHGGHREINVGTSCATWDAPATREEVAFVRSQFARFEPDVLIANYAWLGNVLDIVPPSDRALKVILTQDILSQRMKDLHETGITEPGWDYLWDRDKESAQLHRAQVLLAISNEDGQVLKGMAPLCEVICVPLAVAYHACDPRRQVAGRCLYVGSIACHNVQGLRWFLENVWPIILTSSPDSSLHVCGSVCDEIHGVFENVRLLRRINDLEAEYAEAEVCLSPLLASSGLKIKLIEALSYGRACVSTSLGIPGLRDMVNRAVLVGDSPEEFPSAVCSILMNPIKRKWIEEQARLYMTRSLSPEVVYKPFVDRVYKHVFAEPLLDGRS